MRQLHQRYRNAGTLLLCTMAVLYTVFTVFAVMQIADQTKQIYESPYKVDGEVRTMRARLYELNAYLPSLLSTAYLDKEVVLARIKERNDQQDESWEQVRRMYQGARSDLEELDGELLRLRQARKDVIDGCDRYLTLEEATLLMEERINPYSDAFDQTLQRIIDVNDQSVAEMQKRADLFASICTVAAMMIGALFVAITIYMRWNNSRRLREIQYREELFDILSANIDDVFFIYDNRNKNLEYISANSKRFFGHTDKIVIGGDFPFSRYLSPESVQELKNLFYNGPIYNQVSCNLHYENEGNAKELKIQVYPIITKEEISRYIVMCSDQTAEMEYQQVLKDALQNAQNANLTKRSFLAKMSHEIRTPMNAIIGMTTIALSSPGNEERVRDCLGKIAYSSRHLLALINDILDMSKIEEGKLSIADEVFDLRQMIESLTSLIYPQAEEHQLIFEVLMQGVTDELLRGDMMRVNQILLNLLSNAIKFTPAGGAVRLEVRQLHSKNNKVCLKFTVSDTGIGMSQEFLERLYQPFEQEDISIAQKYGGTGLGMSITKNLVQLMGGNIRVVSDEGVGTTFEVELGFGLAEGSHAYKTEELDKLHVLIVDDDRGTCEHAACLLDQFHIRSKWVLNGYDAVAEVEEALDTDDEYDVCFVDWKMPDMDGIETARQLRRRVGPDTLIIIISAYDFSLIEDTAREAGVNAFIRKPFFASSFYNTLLSATQHERETVTEMAAQNYDFTGKRVLMAEDNELNREIAVELLNMVGMQTDPALNGREALEIFGKSEPGWYDLILMDIQMPEMNGYEATRKIRSMARPDARSIPIIAMTADAFSSDVRDAMNAGMNGHIAKPIDVDKLYQIIKENLF